MRASGVQYHVHADNKDFVCTVRGKLRKGKATTTNLLAVGDEVWVTPTSEDQAVIERINERRSKLSRRSPGREPKEQILAVNVDYAIIVMAAIAPDFNKNRLDRYITASNKGNIRPIVCINKIDLVDEAYIRSEMAVYERLGFTVLYTSAASGQGLDSLQELLKNNVSAFVGSSGVGKSSLINAIQPDLALKTQVLREKFLKGQHTTTTAELVMLEQGGMVVDTPGLREIALWQDRNSDEDDVISSFPEIQATAAKCKFRNCSHSHEPGCEVRYLVETGEIEQARYRNYLKLTK
ncbi:MAG: ribosome bioproteinis GTPase [Bacillota bacterium]|nr:MAG: ribosome bioproteinis GTPase [Bacillota bacterium]